MWHFDLKLILNNLDKNVFNYVMLNVSREVIERGYLFEANIINH